MYVTGAELVLQHRGYNVPTLAPPGAANGGMLSLLLSVTSLGIVMTGPKPDERCLMLQVATMQHLIHVAAAVSVTGGLVMGCCSLVSHHAAPVTTTSVK